MRSATSAGLLMCGLLCSAGPAAADVVVDWNLIATQAVSSAGASRQGPAGLIDMAIVQLAVHDAMQAFQKRFESYGAPMAADHGHPPRRQRRQQPDRRRGDLDALHRHAQLPGLHVGREQSLGVRDDDAGKLLREGQVHVHDDERFRSSNDRRDTSEPPHLLQVLGCGR